MAARDRYALSYLRKACVPALLAGVWVLVTARGWVEPVFLPAPREIWESFVALAPLLPRAVVVTFSMTLGGFAIGVAIGTASGLLMAYSRTLRDLLGFLFDFLRPVPIFALIPLFILWFGIGRAPQIVLIAMGTSVILGVTTLEAIRNVPSIYVRAALTLGASRGEIYRTVIVPYIIPHLVGATRVAAAGSWGLSVAAEFMGSQEGLGYLIIMQQAYLRTAGIILLVAVYSTLAVVVDTLIAKGERHFTRWTERHEELKVVGSIVGLVR